MFHKLQNDNMKELAQETIMKNTYSFYDDLLKKAIRCTGENVNALQDKTTRLVT